MEKRRIKNVFSFLTKSLYFINRELIEREIKMLGSVQEGFDTSASNQQTKVAAVTR